MGIRGIKGLVCGMLGLSIVMLAADTTFSAAPKEGPANADIIKVADGKADAKAVAEKTTTGDVMHAFKVKAKGGIGVGGMEESDGKNSIDKKIIALGGKTPIAPDVLAKESANIARMAQITRAIGEITEHQAPKKGADAWKKFSQDMIKASKDLSEAASKTPADVNKAAKKLETACNECHSKFRDTTD